MRHRSSAVNGCGEVDGAWAVARNRDGPLLSRYGDRRSKFSARAEAPSRSIGREQSMMGFEAACRGVALAPPEPLRRLIPDRLKPTTGGGVQGPPGSTV